MLDFQAIRLMHHHGNGDYAPMREVPEHSSVSHDPERAWLHGSRLYACEACADEVVVLPVSEPDGGAVDPRA